MLWENVTPIGQGKALELQGSVARGPLLSRYSILINVICVYLCRYSGPWTRSPTSFTNAFFTELLERKWTEKKWNGPRQFQDESGDLMMLPSDFFMLQDDSFLKYIKIFAKDEDKFFKVFASAWTKLTEGGCENLQKSPF